MIQLILFGSAFITVFALGFQSLNVNGGHYAAAALTSLVISGGHIALYRFVPDADLIELTAYMAGGCLGIIASMYVHKRTIGRIKRG